MSIIAHACETVAELRAALADIPDECLLITDDDGDGPVRVDIMFVERPSPENIQGVVIRPWLADVEEEYA